MATMTAATITTIYGLALDGPQALDGPWALDGGDYTAGAMSAATPAGAAMSAATPSAATMTGA